MHIPLAQPFKELLALGNGVLSIKWTWGLNYWDGKKSFMNIKWEGALLSNFHRGQNEER